MKNKKLEIGNLKEFIREPMTHLMILSNPKLHKENKLNMTKELLMRLGNISKEEILNQISQAKNEDKQCHSEKTNKRILVMRKSLQETIFPQ